MQIYIMRHGEAVDHSHPSVTSDAMRPLTDSGRDEVAVMARLLEILDVRPDRILSSPFARARQTAEIIAGTVGREGDLSISDELRYGGSLAGVLDDVLRHGRPRQALLTGHMPNVGQLAAYLAWRQPDLIVPFRTGEICRIDLPDDAPTPGSGDLRWLIPPGIARRLVGEG